MSMLSAQADKLRRVADLYDGKTQPPIAKELQRPALAQELRDAADTILSLRDKAQKLQAENDKLREDNACLVKAIEELHSVSLEDRLVALENENDKLRELVRYAYECAIHSDHATCDDCRRMNGYCILERRMRELGIEVGA